MATGEGCTHARGEGNVRHEQDGFQRPSEGPDGWCCLFFPVDRPHAHQGWIEAAQRQPGTQDGIGFGDPAAGSNQLVLLLQYLPVPD